MLLVAGAARGRPKTNRWGAFGSAAVSTVGSYLSGWPAAPSRSPRRPALAEQPWHVAVILDDVGERSSLSILFSVAKGRSPS